MPDHSWEPTSTRPRRPRTEVKALLVNLGGAGVFLGFGALVTWMPPTSVLTLQRGPSRQVTACVTQYVLWILPVATRELANVTQVDTASMDSEPSTTREPGQDLTQRLRPETIGYLILRGERSLTVSCLGRPRE